MATSSEHQQQLPQDMYRPINNRGIRLLSIKPGYTTESIECGFVSVTDLDDAPPYDALSYVWGDEQHPDPITCNGAQKIITKQLADALKHLRKFPGWGSIVPWPEDHPLRSEKHVWKAFAKNRHEKDEDLLESHETLLWVDALCINQDDANERATQVKMMGDIYRRASNVKIWFGKEDKDPPGFIKSLQPTELSLGSFHVGSYGPIAIILSFLAQALRNDNGRKNRLAARTPMGDSVSRNIAYGFPPPSAPEWDVVREFFTNPWFERVWVVQEAVLASNATVLIGDWEIEWPAIGRAATWFGNKGYAIPAVLKYDLRDEQDLLPVSKSASAWRLCSWRDNKVPLLLLLHEFRTRKATNPVDKVYATFGLAQELSDMGTNALHELVEPNYAVKSVVDVYRDVAKFLILEHGNLTVLSHAGSPASDCPSWVPDWRFDKVSNIIAGDHFCASGKQPLMLDVSTDTDTLTLQGIEVDNVAGYGDKLASYGFGFETYQEEVDFVQMAWSLFTRRPSRSSPTSNGGRFETEFYETLTAGVSNLGKMAKDDPYFQLDAEAWFIEHASKVLPKNSIARLLRLSKSGDAGRFHDAFVRACVDRRFFVTRKGSMGIGPEAMKEGDLIVLLFGGRVPYLLRAINSQYRFLGECFIPGLMHGEAIEPWVDGGSRITMFDLV